MHDTNMLVEGWQAPYLAEHATEYADWQARNGVAPSGHHPCVRRLALGLDACRGIQPGTTPDEGCTCDGGAFGCHDELLANGLVPAVLIGYHGARVDEDNLNRWKAWTDRWPSLELVISAGSWIKPGGLVVALYNRRVWETRFGMTPATRQ
ncbi:MAG: hypothetical protein IT360_14315 [Gemmatimonadaceae bacterium]|jgi:hypothetical protein|nr:hypothetical protein [Gemmatimonadaceae bacterium]